MMSPDGVDGHPQAAIKQASDVELPPSSRARDPPEEYGEIGLESLLEPGATYIAPGSALIFGGLVSQAFVIDFLPSRPVADRLVQQYNQSVHFISRVVHWPSFLARYENFWANIMVGMEPSRSLQALIFSILFSAVVTMNDDDISPLFSVSQRSLLASFQTATEIALGKANFLRTTNLETLQALVVYLIPMCRNELSRAHSALVGTAVRLAECMGLHRDPQIVYGVGAREAHIRRILWCQLCFLDIRTTEAQGPRPLLKPDDFDSKIPLNVDDVDVSSTTTAQESNCWTDMTFSKIRFECIEMHRFIWVERSRLEETKQGSLTYLLDKIESFRKSMEERYHPMLDETVPLQKAAKLVMTVLLLRMHMMVLHLYSSAVVSQVPERVHRTVVSTGTQQIEAALCLETDPTLRPWAWYDFLLARYASFSFLAYMASAFDPGQTLC
jgi:hypothetical protein